MRYLFWAILIVSLACEIDASVQIGPQQTEPDETEPEEEEEPHPYTISFFVFPHGAAKDLLDRTFNKKKPSNHHKLITNALKANATPDDTWLDKSNEDIDSLYQRGSIDHPPSEMYPHCHQCDKNSTFDGCTQKETLKVCNKGLANICYTKSLKKGDIVHYQMGCATHKQCQHARAVPCKMSVKKCFTCCQWSGCNSQSHHHKNFPFAHQITTQLSMDDAKSTSTTSVMSWTLVVTSLLSAAFVVI
ncbi:uncharacterized protein LOC110234094 [Exaiptasia diaphana]|uniref:Secreted protein n=1 Tax=Exaiptasia diaphana TaxID=2652724 RepID=A0A913WWH4_EXADI|nr:uncharacterized protein LOC110234094 [Exaiptasia diaphana]KXJ17387.1 hypothetical protein AC249_AIPGENE23750 [Exaiptasia diaphana]